MSANLQHIMARDGIGVRALSRLVLSRVPAGDDPPRGTSYGAIQSYVEGTTRKPRIEALRAIAAALSVRANWLIWGEGEMTAEAERIRRGSAGEWSRDPDSDPEDFWRVRIAQALPEHEYLPDEAKVLVMRAFTRFSDAAPQEWWGVDGRIHPDVFTMFVWILRQSVLTPLVAFDAAITEQPERLRLLPARALGDYLVASLHAFILALPEKITLDSAHPGLALFGIEHVGGKMIERIRILESDTAAEG